MEIILGIGDHAIANRADDVLKTFALGSCVAIVIYYPARQVLAMAHIALPASKINRELARAKPGHFADTAIKLLLDTLVQQYYCPLNGLIINLYGGADSIRKSDVFNIGRRNLLAITAMLDTYGLSDNTDNTGGHLSRTIEVSVATGITKVHTYPLIF
jgi:chemotaxis protein CheD